MAAAAPGADNGTATGLALMMILDQNMSEMDRSRMQAELVRKRRWKTLELVISGLVKRRRFILGEGGDFGVTPKEVEMVNEYVTYCPKATYALLWKKLGMDKAIVIADTQLSAVQNLQPTTPPDGPVTPGSSSGQPPMITAGTERPRGPAPSQNLPLCPPGMETLPKFDRKMFASSHEIVLKYTSNMTENELKIALERILGKNRGLLSAHIVKNGNIAFARFRTP